MHRRSCLTVNTKYMTRVIRRRPFDSEEGGGGTYSDPFSHKLNLIFELKTFRLFNYVNVDTVHVLNLYAVYFFWKELKLN